MERFYDETWGWSDSGKRAELKEDNALYLIGTNEDLILLMAGTIDDICRSFFCRIR